MIRIGRDNTDLPCSERFIIVSLSALKEWKGMRENHMAV
jgi:hypothetical protein